MNHVDIQRLLAAAGYYNGGLDGDLGPKSTRAIDRVISSHERECVEDPKNWSLKRRAIAAAQLILKYAKAEPGPIDGYAGNNTLEAYRSWDHVTVTGRPEEIPREPSTAYIPVKSTFPSQAGCKSFYGAPGFAVEKQLVKIPLPMPYRIDWNLGQHVTTIRIHQKCSSSAQSAFRAAFDFYGAERLKELGLDRFAGSYNHRKMRGGSSWSMHAYGCAIDLYAAPNGLRVHSPKALFSGKDYIRYFEIWEERGWTSLGRTIDRDWMHVQAAHL